MNRTDLETLSREQLVDLVLAQAALIAELQRRVAELEARLGLPPKTPENSSLPPSQGRKPGSGGRRRKAGRKGRPGVARALDPNPTAEREVFADCCPHCRGALAAQRPAAVYDHVELPPVRPQVTRVTLMGGTCPHCRRGFRAAAPADMPAGSPFGPGLRALALHLRFSQGIGFARLQGVFRDVFGVAISQGALVNLVRAAARPFAVQAERLGERLRAGPVIASDETGLRVAGRNGWLWVMHHGDSAVFRADPSRGKRVLADFLGEDRPDFWLSDRYGGQQGFATRGHQFCLAHLIRDAQYAVDAGDTGFAPGFLALLRRACRLAPLRERPERASARQPPAPAGRQAQRAAAGDPDPSRRRRAAEGRRQAPPQPLPLRHQPRPRAYQQRIRARAAPLRHLPQDHRRLPHPMGRHPLRRPPLRTRDRPKTRNPGPPGHRAHPRQPTPPAPGRLIRR